MFGKNLTLLTVNILENSEGHCLFWTTKLEYTY